ncbi:MAG: DegV family protein [Eubacteriales bacterium]|nr:DegV family protein [Eubacteriales bacterium]
MKKRKTVILVDSGCDIPQAFIKKHNIKVLRLRVSYEHEHHIDSVALAYEVYKRFPKEIPRTSTPTMQDYYDMIDEIKSEGYENVLGIFISSQLSSTCQTAQMVLKEYPELHSFVFDSKNISIGAGLLAMWAAKELENKIPFEEVCARLPEKAKDSKVFFYMDTLEYLRKGGRIGGVAAVAGSLLKIKPIISCNEEGSYYTVEKIRGAKAGKEKIIQYVQKMCNDQPAWLALMNGDALDTAAEVKPILKKTIKKGLLVVEDQITATLAIHTGPGLLGIGVLVNP